jgi:hypothetical protein
VIEFVIDSSAERQQGLAFPAQQPPPHLQPDTLLGSDSPAAAIVLLGQRQTNSGTPAATVTADVSQITAPRANLRIRFISLPTILFSQVSQGLG